MNSKDTGLNTVLNTGLQIDLEEAWRKLIERQFGGKPGRAFSELIQNFLDSYPSDMPWTERKGIITSTSTSISICDFGSGLNQNKLELITTLGGTDKSGDISKIGAFGIGFFSIFSPKLGTKKLLVSTNCEGVPVELTFDVQTPGKIPKITSKIKKYTFAFSTKIEVIFDNSFAVRHCLNAAHESLKYYPCEVTINGKKFRSVWEQAKQNGDKIFKTAKCDGFIQNLSCFYNLTLLCKYERVMDTTMAAFITGGSDMTQDLRDFEKNGTPYIPKLSLVLNCNRLSLTISRDGFFLNYAYKTMKTEMNTFLLEQLGEVLQKGNNTQLILANQYIFQTKIRDFLNRESIPAELSKEDKTIKTLAEAKVYKIVDKRDLFSLSDIKRKLSEGLPLFFTPGLLNTRWLGGNFKKDFIVSPNVCLVEKGAPNFYDSLFVTIFNDVVNLDSITENSAKIKELTERGIVTKEALSPMCKFIGTQKLSQTEESFLYELQELLSDPEITAVIEKYLTIPVNSVKPVFFDVKAEGAYISMGLFDENNAPINEEFISNFQEISKKDDEVNTQIYRRKNNILLGLRLSHPLIQYLMKCDDPHKIYYTMTYVAHEISLCQKLLVPYSPFYHFVKEKIAGEIRKVMIQRLLCWS